MRLVTLLPPCSARLCAGPRRAGAWTGALLAAAVITGATATAVAQSGEGLSGYAEVSASRFENTTENTGLVAQSTRTDTLAERVNLAFSRRLWPNLRLRLGGFFESVRSDFRFVDPDADRETSKSRRVNPYFGLTLRTPIYLVDLTYARNEQRFDRPDDSAVTNVREVFGTTLGWSPDSAPKVQLRYLHTNDYDTQRVSRDTSQDLLQLTSDYRPIPSLHLFYRGSYIDTLDRLGGSEVQATNHSARVAYGDAFWNRRVALNTTYEVTYRTADTKAPGIGVFRFPITLVSAGLSALDDTPDQGALDPNPNLIDENVTASAGINLGHVAPGGDRRLRNLGLDFGSETEVNTLYVWVDRELPLVEVADTFAWDVFTSTDNQRWIRLGTVTALNGASFDALQKRFEIDFNTVTTRYVKLVVAPLANDPLGQYTNIFVTELTGEVRRSAADVRGKTSFTSQVFNLDIRTRIFDVPSLYYEFATLASKSGNATTRYLVSNGLALSHAFNQQWSTSARVAYEFGEERAGTRHAFVYTAGLAASPLTTLQQSLVFSGRTDDINGFRSRQNSVILNTIAELYRGIDLNVSVGRSFTRTEGQPTLQSTQVNATTTITPNPAVTLNLIYQRAEDAFQSNPRPGELAEAREINLAWRPLVTLYLFGSRRIEERARQEPRHLANYALSWLPFPGGALHVNFSYTESASSQFDPLLAGTSDTTERTLSPALRWDISPRSYFDLAYLKRRIESPLQRIEEEILSGTLRFVF